jgi:hypothetical protein
MKDILIRLKVVADIKDSSSIPEELHDNQVFLAIMADAIAEIERLRKYEDTIKQACRW